MLIAIETLSDRRTTGVKVKGAEKYNTEYNFYKATPVICNSVNSKTFRHKWQHETFVNDKKLSGA